MVCLRTTQNGESVGDARPAHFVRSSSRDCAVGAVCARGAQFSFCGSSQLVVSSIFFCVTCCVMHIAHSAMAQETTSMRCHQNLHLYTLSLSPCFSLSLFFSICQPDTTQSHSKHQPVVICLSPVVHLHRPMILIVAQVSCVRTQTST